MSYNEWSSSDFGNNQVLEIIDGDRGKNYPNGEDFQNTGYCLFLNTKNVTKTGFDFTEKMFITKEKDEVLRKGKLIGYDVVMTTRGTVGNIAYFDPKIEYKNVRINSGMVIIRAKKFLLQPKFLYYILKNPIFQEKIRQFSTGSAQPQLPISTIKKVDFSFPDLIAQKKIANILSSLDDKIDLNNKINRNLETLAQTLYKHWFVDFEFPNENGEPYKSSGGEMVDSELGLIPKGWKLKTIDEITIFNKRGIAPSYTNDKKGIPVINQRCIRNHTIIEEAVQYHNPDAKKTPDDLFYLGWDVLINSMGVGTLGRASVSSVDQKRLVHSCITILRPNTNIISKPIFAYMMLFFEQKIIQMGEGTTGQTSLSNKLLGQLKVAVPHLSMQEKISTNINSMQRLIDKNYLENQKLSEIRDTLLPKLMNGEIEVPV